MGESRTRRLAAVTPRHPLLLQRRVGE